MDRDEVVQEPGRPPGEGSPTPASGGTAVRRPLWARKGVWLTVLVVAAAALWWTEGRGRRMFIPRNWGVVEEGAIYRSGQLSRFLLERTLASNDIGLVIDLAADREDDEDAAAQRRILEEMGIEFVQFTSLDGSGRGDPQDYVDALGHLLDARKQDKRVLVHCAAGSERTGRVVAAYRMLYDGWSSDRTYEEYLSYRHRPPEVPKMSIWMRDVLPIVARRLHETGRLERVPDTLPALGPAGKSED